MTVNELQIDLLNQNSISTINQNSDKIVGDLTNTKSPPTRQKRKPKSAYAIRLLLVNGDHFEYYFRSSDSIETIKNRVWIEWPTEWKLVDKGTTPDSLRLLHHGRFLEDYETISSLNLSRKEVTTFHLLVKNPTTPTVKVPKFELSPKFCGLGCSIL